MIKEVISVRGDMISHTVVPIIGDGACLFRCLSYLLYGTQVMAKEIREEIVDYVIQNWNEISIMTHDPNGDNYVTAESYNMDMSRENTYGGLSELYAAAHIFGYVFEVYCNGVIYVTFGEEGNPVGRLRFTHDLSNGHFEVYLPCDLQYEILPTFTDPDHNINNVVSLLSPSFTSDTVTLNNSPETLIVSASLYPQHLNSQSPLPPTNTSKKRRTRLTGVTRRKQIRNAAKKYSLNNADVHRSSVAKF